MENKMKLRLECIPASVDVAGTMVATFASLNSQSEVEILDIKNAVQEAVSNCVDHAYGDFSVDNVIDVSVALKDQGIIISVRDSGCGIQSVKRARQPLFTTRPDRNKGMGFTVMETFMDEVKVSTKCGKGTTVTLKRRMIST
ncbi:MAG: anti-sigma F factor [Clostridia bacterium]|jgi:stage II sporulation protein AB (anti-sigma F factor)|nr:anti-sigma F factor [Clostridia bacterium]